MARRKSIGIRKQLTSLLPARRLHALARETGVLQRRRKVDPMALFWAIVLGFAAGRKRSLAGMRRAYEQSTGTTLVPSAFYDRFTQPLATLFQRVAGEMMQAVQQTETRFAGVLASFRDVIATDSSLVKLHDLLERSFPACRTNHTKAAAKLHVVMSVRGQGPRSVKLTSGRQHDGPVFRVGRWVRDRLLLFDLGYFRYQLFDCIDRNGGYFVSRLKENANPRITATLRQWRGRSVPVVGERLREVLGRLRREEIDLEVEVEFRRRVYAGKRSGKQRTWRLVGILNAETHRYHLYLTNIPADRLSAREVAHVYGARWQVELIFKELKSYYRLEHQPSRKRHIVEVLLYAAVVTLIVSRHLLEAIRTKLRSLRRTLPEHRWAALFATVATGLLHVLLLPPRVAHSLSRWLESMLLHEAIDPNLSRKLLLARVENAVTR